MLSHGGRRAHISQHAVRGCVKHNRLFSRFRIVEHEVRTQHTRHWPRGTEIGYENALRLAVKQYIPLEQDTSQQEKGQDVTFIAAHANGFPKELYEPMFDDLHDRLKALGRSIRGIWVADLAHQGQSYALNEKALGNDPNWWDGARDLLFFVNQMQDAMPQPLIGIGHSMGGSQLAQLALLHPRLLQALILIDPVIQTENPSKSFAKPSTYRRDIWPSREEAREKFASSKFYQAWDSRVLDKWNQYGLRDLPTELYPDPVDATKPPVTLATPKSQEVFSYLRPKYNGTAGLTSDQDRENYGDIHSLDVEPGYPFYRPEPAQIFRRLEELKPPVLYIFGKHSALATPELRQKKMESTGVGLGGSGGRIVEKVHEVVLDCGHLVPFEKVQECAEAAASFTASELSRWEQQTRDFQERWLQKSRQERIGIDKEWKEHIGPRDMKKQ